MKFANCPKCGSFNVTTAGDCADCGWNRFSKVTGAGESKEAIYNLVGEIEIKVTGKALLDDYKRLLFENNSLTARIAELETKIRHNALWQASEDAEERAHLEKLVPDLKKRIAELEESEKHWAGNVKVSVQLIDQYEIRTAELEEWINKFIGEGYYLSLLNGLTLGDSGWDKLVAEFRKSVNNVSIL